MKILYLTDIPYTGPFTPDFSMGYRPFMSWVPAMEALHHPFYKINELPLDEKFDIVIIGSINNTLSQPKSFNELGFDKLRLLADKVLIQQESYHRSFLHDSIGYEHGSSHLIDYYNFIESCDAILTHNDIDSIYFSTLFSKPCFIHPQLIIPLDLGQKTNFEKDNSLIVSSFSANKDKGGGIDSYFLLKHLNIPIYSFGPQKEELPGLNYLPYDPDYVNFNHTLSKFKIGVNIPFLPIGGSFPLQCAMMKVPCVGWNTSNPLRDCFPDLVCDYADHKTLKQLIDKLLTDKEFYESTTEQGYKNFMTKYSYESYIERITNIFNAI